LWFQIHPAVESTHLERKQPRLFLVESVCLKDTLLGIVPVDIVVAAAVVAVVEIGNIGVVSVVVGSMVVGSMVVGVGVGGLALDGIHGEFHLALASPFLFAQV